MAAAVNPWIRYASWLLPHGVHVWKNRVMARRAWPELVGASVLSANASIRGAGRGRCFILANGPSVKHLDLTRLRGQSVFSVSNGYLHAGYDMLAPEWHCLPQISRVRMTEADIVTWFQEMHAHLGNAELFLCETEAELVKAHGLFAGRVVRYVALRGSFDELRSDAIIDVSRPIPAVESVPVMVLMIAMYMGFREIVLLGVDHDHFRTGRYQYAFNAGVQQGKDYTVTADGQVTTPLHDEFQSLARLWRQYRALGRIADANGIRVINANPQSALDEFPRMSLEELLNAREVHA